MIRKILVPVRGDGKGDNVLAHAAVLARRYKAHVEITHCRARPEDMMPFGVPIPGFLKKQLLDHAASLADQEEEGLQAEVEALAKQFDEDLDIAGFRRLDRQFHTTIASNCGNPLLIDRAEECEAVHDRAATFVTVDFTDIGDVFAAVDILNGVN